MKSEKQIILDYQDSETVQEVQDGELPFVSDNMEAAEPEAPPEKSEEIPPALPPRPNPEPEPPKKRGPAPKAPTAKQPTRQVMSVAVSTQEYEYLQKIFEARKESGLSGSWNQFLKQCINFAVNWQKGWQFGVPKNPDKVYLD